MPRWTSGRESVAYDAARAAAEAAGKYVPSVWEFYCSSSWKTAAAASWSPTVRQAASGTRVYTLADCDPVTADGDAVCQLGGVVEWDPPAEGARLLREHDAVRMMVHAALPMFSVVYSQLREFTDPPKPGSKRLRDVIERVGLMGSDTAAAAAGLVAVPFHGVPLTVTMFVGIICHLSERIVFSDEDAKRRGWRDDDPNGTYDTLVSIVGVAVAAKFNASYNTLRREAAADFDAMDVEENTRWPDGRIDADMITARMMWYQHVRNCTSCVLTAAEVKVGGRKRRLRRRPVVVCVLHIRCHATIPDDVDDGSMAVDPYMGEAVVTAT